MTAEVTFPIYLVKRGSVDIEQLYDFRQLEEWVVIDDVLNDRYLVWDFYGRPLRLGRKLDYSLCSLLPDDSLKRFFEDAGNQYDLSFGELTDEIDVEVAFKKLKNSQKAAIKTYQTKNKKSFIQ